MSCCSNPSITELFCTNCGTFDYDSVFEIPVEKVKPCCSNPQIIEDRELICTNCGIISDKNVSTEAEYRMFSSENGTSLDSVRCSGNTTNYVEHGLSTQIHDSGKSKIFFRISKFYTQKSYRQKIISEVIEVLGHLEQFGIKQTIIDHTIALFLDILGIEKDVKFSTRNNKKVVKGDNRKGLIGVCLHQAFLEIGISRNLDEISKILNINSKRINQAYEKYILLKTNDTLFNISGISNNEMIENYSNQLNLSFKMSKFIRVIYSVIESNGFFVTMSMRPKSLILGLFYFIFMEFQNEPILNKIQEEIKISKHTLKKVYKSLLDKKVVIFQETKKIILMERFKKLIL